jgi:hypothetical protein
VQESQSSGLDKIPSTLAIDADDANCVFFNSDRIYEHYTLKINYTTYDVRREQDIINPHTSHCDIMMLASDNDDDDSHPYWYARVIGIFHVNVIYTGTGMLDYLPRRLDFLWVRWFQYDATHSIGWDRYKLDPLRFPPLSSRHAFGFVDPRNVLRACHIVQGFKSGKLHSDGVSISRCAQDGGDWRRYFVNRYASFLKSYFCSYAVLRFADRDMMMRYHWGFAIGHIYTHVSSQSGAHGFQNDEIIEGDSEFQGTLDAEAQDPSGSASDDETALDLEYSLDVHDDDVLDNLGASDIGGDSERSDVEDVES